MWLDKELRQREIIVDLVMYAWIESYKCDVLGVVLDCYSVKCWLSVRVKDYGIRRSSGGWLIFYSSIHFR